jgi:hypothetical protein
MIFNWKISKKSIFFSDKSQIKTDISIICIYNNYRENKHIKQFNI